MKKLFTFVLCALACVCTAFGFAACSLFSGAEPEEKTTVSVYAPDGAPALALAKLMKEESGFGLSVDYNIVASTAITGYVTGENPAADICILPSNAAVKLLGSAEQYRLLGTVTHGNLYLLKKEGGEDIAVSNLDALVGKTVGVIQLANVPGLTFKTILKENGIEYNDLSQDGVADPAKVNLKGLADGTAVVPSDATCDYFVVSEPVATTKVNATAGKLAFAGDLQELYGEENGYPQAVIVAKNSLVDSHADFLKSFLSAVEENARWLLGDVSYEEIVDAIIAHLPEGYTPMFTAANLNKQVVENCGIRFVSAADGKEEINRLIAKFNELSASSWGTASDAFFCTL